MHRDSSDSRRGLLVPALVMATTVAVFVAVAFSLTLRLRADLREQILRREAEALRSMVGLQQERAADEFKKYGLGAEPSDWFPLLLETSRLRGVVALRLFDPSARLRDALPMPASAQIPATDWTRVTAGENFARLHPRVAPESLRIGEPAMNTADGVPLLEVLVPLRDPARHEFGGVAQYWIDGAPMEQEFAMLDRHLWLRSGLAAAVGAAVVLAALAWAFRRLRTAHRELQARTEDLARANHEFSLAAKTSALGAITAHLIHGLKNPLAGLEGYVSSQPNATDTAEGGEWHAAMETTQRLRTLVNEVVAILREEQTGGPGYKMTSEEILEQAEAKLRPLAKTHSVNLAFRCEDYAELPSRRANLVLLVLDNLLRNACEATPSGGRVALSAVSDPHNVVFFVEDEGPGLATAVKDRLFEPVTSTKPGGGGIGLVISHHLAQHAGGRLELLRSNDRGCRFRLTVPL